MKGDVVPDHDHVTRYCGGAHLRPDGTVSDSAFRPRPGETFLSVNWLEYFGAISDPLEEIRRVLASKLKIGGTARLARINIVGMRSLVLDSTGLEVSVLHEPEESEEGSGRPADPSHCGIHGLPDDDKRSANLLARSVLSLHPART